MTHLKDLTGKLFGRLTVLKYYGLNSRKHHSWVCRCECGSTAIVSGDALRNGSTRSCGCLAHEAHVAAGKRHKGPSPRFVDLTGQTFGFLTVIERGPNTQRGNAKWHCKCVCGRETFVVTSKLRNGRTISCGCMGLLHATQAKIKHGDSKKTRLYAIWAAMKRRCYNPNCDPYKYYGGKGIKVCDEWLEYDKFREWALSNGYAEDLSIDRIDSNGNYEPGNCQWITMQENRLRAKRLPLDIKEKVIEMLRRKASGLAIIRECHVSRPTISRIKAEIGLAVHRKKPIS